MTPLPRTRLGLALLLAGATLAGAAWSAPTIWRCGGEARAYADRPCDDGRPILPEAGPGPSRVSEARTTAARERALAESLAAERHARDRLPTRWLASGIRMNGQDLRKETPSDKAYTHIAGDSGKRRPARKGHAAAPKDPRVTFEIRLPARAAPGQADRKRSAP